jgi:hypothetical protein
LKLKFKLWADGAAYGLPIAAPLTASSSFPIGYIFLFVPIELRGNALGMPMFIVFVGE